MDAAVMDFDLACWGTSEYSLRLELSQEASSYCADYSVLYMGVWEA